MQTVVGGYQLLEQLGRGASGVVMRATDARGAEVALKLITARDADAGSYRRFLREAGAHRSLDHANIVRTYGAGADAGRLFIAMELVRGESLETRLARGGPLPLVSAVGIARKLALALGHAHDRDVLHRDLKPSNILFDERGEPRLTDFGLARSIDMSATQLTHSGSALGTPGYWPPEQATGQLARIGPASDIYALGATLFAMLTGGPPFEAASIPHSLIATLREPATPPSRRRREVDESLDAIVLRCMEKEPADRYGSALELAADLDRWLAEAGVRPGSGAGSSHGKKRSSASGSRRERGPAPRRGLHPALVATGALAIGAGGMALGVLFFGGGSRREPPARIAQPAPDSVPDSVPDRAPAPAPAPDPAPDPRADLAHVDALIADAPGDHALRVHRARLLQQLEDWEGVDREATAVLDAVPGHAMALRLRSTARVKLGEWEGALTDIDALRVAEATDDPVLLGMRGLVLLGLGRAEEAERDLARAVTALPEQRELATALAQARRDLRDADDPAHAALQEQAARAFGSGRLAEARAAYDRVLELDPDDLEARSRRALALMFLGAEDRGEGDAERVLAAPEGLASKLALAAAHQVRGRARANRQQMSEALADYDAAIAYGPDNLAARHERGVIHARLGDHIRANRDFDAVLQGPRASRHELDARLLRGFGRHQLRQWAGAAEDLERALQLMPANAPLRAQTEAMLQECRAKAAGRD